MHSRAISRNQILTQNFLKRKNVWNQVAFGDAMFKEITAKTLINCMPTKEILRVNSFPIIGGHD